jgi:hypothetical protein
MLAGTVFTTAFFALVSFAVASPPGCLLGAVNTYDGPSDLKAVCSEKDAAKTIQKFCGDSTKEALEAFADICNSAGVKVCTYTRCCTSDYPRMVLEGKMSVLIVDNS